MEEEKKKERKSYILLPLPLVLGIEPRALALS